MPSKQHCRGSRSANRKQSGLKVRLGIFSVLALLTIGVTGWLLWPKAAPDVSADQTIEVTMAGFKPGRIRAPAGAPTTVLLKNPDSPFHTDGGGVHQFAVPELGIDLRVQPRSTLVATIPATEPGSYTFYCDTCCGGKENPSMRGTLVVA